MFTWLGRIFAAMAILTLFAITAVRAEIADADREAFRGIIASQIEAFQRDDDAAAYSYASPTIQGLFPTAERFMAMVRSGYQPVYRPRSVTFGPAVDTPRGPEQRVFVTGPDGRNWVAIYSLQRQPDGSWRINGCVLVEDTGESI
ncbi:MAG TPA: DUF4864 domain-containing protein [Bauldia sp.]|nr:DUF4864 domain-containing protein [Bauldia sp.]